MHDATSVGERGWGPRAPRPPQRVLGAGGGGRRDRRDPTRPTCGSFEWVGRASSRGACQARLGAVAGRQALISLGAGERCRLGLRSRLRAAGLIFYFDTSALVKLVVVEDGSERAAELWNGAYPVASSILVYPESRAALAAARRLDRLGAAEHGKALVDFEDLYGDLAIIGIDQDLAVRAGQCAEDLGLRGYDSVHLATALELGDDEVVMVTWDRDLARAAERVGLGVAGSG
jgi:uncharacterized protein